MEDPKIDIDGIVSSLEPCSIERRPLLVLAEDVLILALSTSTSSYSDGDLMRIEVAKFVIDHAYGKFSSIRAKREVE